MLRTKEKQALDLDLDLLPGGTIRGGKRRALCGATVPPGREERGTDEASGESGGARRERGPSGQARARCSARPCPQAGRQSAARAALAGTEGTCYPCGGLHPASATGARGGPEPTGPLWGTGGERVSRAPEGPAKALESARNPIACRSSDAPGRSVDRDGGRGTPVDGTTPGQRRRADGGGTDAATCEGAESLLDKRNSISSPKWMSDFFRPRTSGEVMHNGRVILSPAGEVLEVCTASRPIFRDTGFDPLPTQKSPASTQKSPASTQFSPESSQKGARRARKELFLCAACNPDLDCFVTFTQAPDKVDDRYDYKEAVRRLGRWLDNRVRRRGLKYIFVPELHQDGAVHWHGLCSSAALRLVDSGHKDKRGRVIFNVDDWTYGFTTATMVSDHLAACRYVTKYITKGMAAGTIGGRYWLHGGRLARPIVHLFDTERPLPGAAAYDVPEAGLRLWYGVNWNDRLTTEREEEGMRDENGVYHEGEHELAHAGDGATKCAGYPSLHGNWPAPERLLGPPLARPTAGWQDMGRIDLDPGWAADWLPDDDPRRYFQLDRGEDGEAEDGGDHGQSGADTGTAVEDMGALPVGLSGEGLDEASDETSRVEGPEAG